MIVRRLHKVHELLSVLAQDTSEMQTLHALLTENWRYPSRRTWEQRLKAIPDTLPAQIGCFGRVLVALIQPWAHCGRAAAIDSTVLRANGGVWHNKHREQGIVLSPFDGDASQHYTASKMFMSCFSFGPLGVIEGDALIARAEAKLLGRADKLIVLADSSKFETRGSMAVCPLSRVHTLITDDEAPEAVLDQVRQAGVNVIVVSAERADISFAA